MKGKPKAVNIYTVAERAQVSISTVSLVMNSPHRVSPQTRERVMRAASELGYRVGGEGERGSGRTTALRVAVAAPYSSYNSYYRRLTGMLHRARQAAVDLIPYTSPRQLRQPNRCWSPCPPGGVSTG
ncbi:LacI family DNA-binding transcriptional regulator [Naumannella halotolerans]|uniref:LacI family DNA-binding transcriptional regulator n=1 Tax=Naumannella halotolerans TaxID=993414 RepID=UPI00370D04D8